MKKSRRLAVLTAVMVAAAMTLSACGGGASSKPAETKAAETEAAETAAAGETEAAAETEAAETAAAETEAAGGEEAAAGDLNSKTLDEIIAAAQEEGHISSVGMPDGWANWEMLWADVLDNYGIDHDDVDMSSAEELNMFATDPTKDIGDVGQAFGPQAVEQDLVQGYKTSYWDSVADYAKGEDGKWMMGYMGVTTFLANEDLIEEEVPTSWADIANGSYKVSFGDIGGGNCQAAITALALGVGEGKTLQDIDLDAAFDFLSELANAGRINTVDITQANFESGEVPVGVVWSFTGLPYSQKIENYKMTAVVPSDGAVMSGYASVINKNAAHPNAAALAREVIFSDAGQTYLALAGAVTTRSDFVVPDEYADQTLSADQYANAVVIEDTDLYSSICAQIVERWNEEIQPLLIQ